jgi:gamma-glutamylcyclotransferase (GGCT)/AIG2-like uncharacterized protein YtfP
MPAPDDDYALDRPYFVYGTLRPGYGNSRIWESHGATVGATAWAHGYMLIVRGRLPYAVPGLYVDRVKGVLIEPPPDEAGQRALRRDLDMLEGHPAHYMRKELTTCAVNYEIVAPPPWIYTPTWNIDGEIVHGGDYALHTPPPLGTYRQHVNVMTPPTITGTFNATDHVWTSFIGDNDERF